MNGKNICKKYKITELEYKSGIDIISKNLGKICNGLVMVAVCELLVAGDIEVKENEKNN